MTVIAAAIIAEATVNGRRILIIAHRREITAQTAGGIPPLQSATEGAPGRGVSGMTRFRAKYWRMQVDSKRTDRPPYRIPETARRLGISDQSIRKTILRGELDAFRVGRPWLIRPESVDRLLRGEAA